MAPSDPIDIDKIENVREAIYNSGPVPGYHYAQLARLRTEWPTLYYAIMDLLGEK